MSGNELNEAMTRYEEAEEEQMETHLGEEEESEQDETLCEDDDEEPFQDTMFYEEEDEIIEEEEADSEQVLTGGEHVKYRLGDYFVPEGADKIGSGGQAEVYKCYRKGRTTEIFAAKVHKGNLSKEKRDVIETIRDMESECESIYKIYASGYVDGESGQDKTYMIVTKLYEKLDEKYLKFDINGIENDYYEKLRCAVDDLNNALITMHTVKIKGGDRHIYHSDIKPQNIMWNADGRGGKGCLVLIDFDGGVMNDNKELRSMTNNAETKAYTAPELAHSRENRVNVYTDNYSLGITLAELVAGVTPRISELVSSHSEELDSPRSKKRKRLEAEKEYYNKYKDRGVKLYHKYLLPAELPGYVQTLFKGLLYHDDSLVEERLGQKERWDDSKLREWIDKVTAGRYEEAEKLPCGGSVVESDATVVPGSPAMASRAAAMPVTDSVKCRIVYNDGAVRIRSVEEMAEQFVKHWTETVSMFMTDPKFPENFRDLGSSVSHNLEVAQTNMGKKPKEKDAIFEKQVIAVYLSDDFKRENLRYYGRVYASKEEFGQKLYAGMIASRDKGNNAYGRLPEVEKNSSREFNDILSMFSEGIVSEFLAGGNPRWQVDGDTLQIIRKTERHTAGDRLNAKTVENLYRIAFRLRGKTAHMIGKKMYSNYAEFGKQLLRLTESDMKSAIAIQKQCMTDDGRLKVDMYAWMQETEGVVVCPTEEECEKF